MKKILAFVMILCLTLAFTPTARTARLSEAERIEPPAEEMVTIDFRDVDLRIVAKFISELVGKNFIFDQQVKGTVTIYSPTKVTKEEAYRLFESVLEVNGFTTIEDGAFTKIVPSQKARTKALEMRVAPPATRKKGDRMITQLIRLQYAPAGEMRKLLMPLMDRTGVMMAYDAGNILIITDFESNIARLLDIIRDIDVEGKGTQLKVIPLKHASAADLAAKLTQLFKAAKGAQGRTTVDSAFNAVADERTNSLIVMYQPGEQALVEDLIAKLDTAAPRGADKVHVYFLENSEAEALAGVLNSIAGGGAAPTASEGKGEPGSGVLLQGTVTIVAEKTNNALIIRADPQDYNVLSSIIKKLDIQRAQVLVEGLIMELSFQKALSLGTEWRSLGALDGSSDTTVGVGGTNFTGALNNMVQNPLSLPSGFVFGAAQGTITFGGNTYANIGLLIQALQTDSDINILSTPHLLTMDNEEASIVVGEERPFLKGSVTDSGATTKTYEFKDLGITLKLTPQISQTRFVKLNLYLEIKNFVAEAETGAVTSTKRETQTTVMVADGETVVIGGLVRDDKRSSTSMVPCMGSIPLLGWLFKARNDSADKENLLILITPTIVRTPERLKALTDERKEEAEKAKALHEEEKKKRHKDAIKTLSD